MIYFFFDILLRLTARVFFQHIYVSNRKNVPYNKPVMLAANHPGAFLDPVLLVSLLYKPIHYLVRGDVFKNPVARWIFTRFKMIPIFRIDEGFENIGRNAETAKMVAEALKKNGIVLVFCEAYSARDRRLRKVRKGTARLCMQIASEYNLDLQLIATGISYSHKKNFRKEAIVDFAEPIRVQDHMKEFDVHPQKGYTALTRVLEGKLKPNFVEIRYEACDELAELHLNYLRNTWKIPVIPVVMFGRERLEAERRVSIQINNLYESNPNNFIQLQSVTNRYEDALKKAGVTDKGLIASYPVFAMLALVLCLPLVAAGAIFWGIPFIISRWVADKKVTRVDFYDSVHMNLAGLLFGLLLLIGTIAAVSFIGWWGILLALPATVSGIAWAQLLDCLETIREKIKAGRCPDRENLLALRRDALHYITTV